MTKTPILLAVLLCSSLASAQVLRDRFYGATRQIEVATGSGRLEIETAARDHFANVRVPRDAIQFLRNN